jgi:hypothetical protein
MIKRRVQVGANGMLTEYADPALETPPQISGGLAP